MLSAYWSPEKFEAELRVELGSSFLRQHGRLLISSEPARELVWAHSVWSKPSLIEISSIGDASKKLRALRAGPWAIAPLEHLRRSVLIEEQVRGRGRKPPSKLSFLSPVRAKLGEFGLIEPGLMIASSETSSWIPQGEPTFEESPEAPSRAYLKLWEFFTTEGVHPVANQTCLDLGASPGGWTWVLASLGAKVTSIDKADLAPHVAKMPGVKLLRTDAFKLKPSDIGPLDWLFSDVICEPRRLLELVQTWRESGLCRNFVCTIKFKGTTDFDVLNDFLKIPGSHARHLFHNKHEVTWWLIQDPPEILRPRAPSVSDDRKQSGSANLRK
jgi:23S rRNA (cytidine2498-2'-O)-methyltransferase